MRPGQRAQEAYNGDPARASARAQETLAGLEVQPESGLSQTA